MAAYVVYVGNAYTDVDQKKQWVFVTDGSLQYSDSGKIANSLLAISFRTSSMDDLHSPLISHNLVGSVVKLKILLMQSIGKSLSHCYNKCCLAGRVLQSNKKSQGCGKRYVGL